MSKNAITFEKSHWDTNYFGVTSAKAIFHRSIKMKEFEELKFRFEEFQFISIVNINSAPANAQLIGKETSAFLADINIQFEKKHLSTDENPKYITIHQALEKNEQILEIVDFQYSKFIEDPGLNIRGGTEIYRQWILNSFDKHDKFYALSKNEMNKINGFTLFSYADDVCVIELISVSQKEFRGGIGTKLFKAVEYECKKRGIKKIKVGTQVRNTDAINFYHKVGCKQVGCHQVYHLWNLK